jgi:hypothetical protein
VHPAGLLGLGVHQITLYCHDDNVHTALARPDPSIRKLKVTERQFSIQPLTKDPPGFGDTALSIWSGLR